MANPDPSRPIILHVDDNEADLELTQLAISENTSETLRYIGLSDGEAALRLLRDLVQPPSQRVAMLMLDINIPRLTGWDIIAAVHGDDRLSHIPIIMLSGSRGTVDLARAETWGVPYVVKPGTYTELVAEMRQVLASHHLLPTS